MEIVIHKTGFVVYAMLLIAQVWAALSKIKTENLRHGTQFVGLVWPQVSSSANCVFCLSVLVGSGHLPTEAIVWVATIGLSYTNSEYDFGFESLTVASTLK